MDSRFFFFFKKIKEGIVCIKKEFRYNKSNGNVSCKKKRTEEKGASV